VIVMFQFRVGTPPELKSTYVLQILGFLISYPKNLNAAPVLHGNGNTYYMEILK
jgi:hypothetical protein